MHSRISVTIGALIFVCANGLTIAARSQPLSTVDRSIAVNASPGGVLQPKSRSTTASNLVTNAERLSVKVLGYAELTGEYRLNADETISLPVLGRVSVTYMTLVELERELTERVSRITNREAFVNVEVAEYKPVFVSGAVTRPGPAPWKPGMTVLHALTLTGDLLKSPDSLAADIEVTRWERATSELKRVLATLARLRSEQSETFAIAAPARLLEIADKKEADALIGSQIPILVSRRTAYSAQIATLERTEITASQELDGLRAQLQRIKESSVTRQDFKQKVESLIAKGYARAERSMEEQLKLNEIENQATNVVFAILKVESVLAAAQRDRANLTQERRAAIENDIIRLEREGAQYEIELKATRAAHLKLTGIDLVTSSSEKQVTTRLEVVRSENGQTQTMSAKQFTPLQPGDILVVTTDRLGSPVKPLAVH